MFLLLRSFSYIGLLTTVVVARAFASPAEGKLLPLVPGGVEIVAGIEDPHNENSHGRLLLVTHNNNVDLNDWLALTGVDAHRQVDEVIQVAASSPRGELREHLLLIAGRFDQEHIFNAAEHNGATTNEYQKETVLVIKPFAREQQQMQDIRWMAILNHRTAIFGTPWLVSQSLNRYAAHTATDTQLTRRLAQLRPDVNSWNVLAMSSRMLIKHVEPQQVYAPWAHILDGANELTIGIHYGSRARLDFAIHTDSDQQSSHVADLVAQPHLMQVSSPLELLPRLENISVEHGHVQGSMSVPGKQFDAWLEAFYRSRASTPDSR